MSNTPWSDDHATQDEGTSIRTPQHILSFDIEEYFQAEASREAGVRPDQWDDLDSRLAPPFEEILALLDRHGAKATFFLLGWVAKKHPQWVSRCRDAGHEIASHGMSHRMLTTMTPDEALAELTDSRKLLEDLAGDPVRGFRAPTFSVTLRNPWAIDVLAEAGYEYDSSVFPVRHDRYGVPSAPRWPHVATGLGGGSILELPPTTWRVAGRNVPAGGGGYLRLFPTGILASALRQAEAAGQPGMIYLHPWEFDPDQPVLPMGRVTTWRHRVNLRRTAKKLSRLMEQFAFGSVEQFLPKLAQTERTFDYA